MTTVLNEVYRGRGTQFVLLWSILTVASLQAQVVSNSRGDVLNANIFRVLQSSLPQAVKEFQSAAKLTNVRYDATTKTLFLFGSIPDGHKRGEIKRHVEQILK